MYVIEGNAPSGESLDSLYRRHISKYDRTLKTIVHIDGSEIPHGSLSDVSISYSLTEDSGFEMGIFTCAQLKMSVKKSVPLVEGSKVFIETELLTIDSLGNEIWINVPIGVFYVHEITNSYLSKEIIAYDKAFFCSKEYLTIKNETGTSISKIIEDINNNANLRTKFGGNVIDPAIVKNKSYPVHLEDLEEITVRVAIGFIAGTTGSYARVNEKDEIEFFNLKDTSIEYDWTQFGSFEVQDYERVITRLECVSAVKDSMTGEVVTDITINIGDGEDVYDFENPFITSEGQLLQVYSDESNNLIGLRYQPCRLKVQGNPRLHIGDFISVVNKEKANLDKWCDTTYNSQPYKFPIMNMTTYLNNGCMMEIEAVADKDRRRAIYRGGSVTEQLRALRKQLEKAKEDNKKLKDELDYARGDYDDLNDRLEGMPDHTMEVMGDRGFVANEVVNNLKVEQLEATQASIAAAIIGSAQVQTLFAEQATIEEGWIRKAIIESLDVSKVNANQIAANAIKVEHIDANKITAEWIATDAIETKHIDSKAITAEKIDVGAITAEKIDVGAITAEKIAANAVTAEKIKANNIESTHIKSETIQTEHLTSKVITGEYLDSNVVSTDHIATGAIRTEQIESNAVIAGKIAANAVTTEKLHAGAVTAEKILSKTITAEQIAGGAITAAEIKSETITAAQIAGNTILAKNLDVGNVTAAVITAEEFKAAKISAENITAGNLDLARGITITGSEGDGTLSIDANRLQFLEPNDTESPTHLGNVRIQLGKYSDEINSRYSNDYGLIVMGYKRDKNGNLVYENGELVYDWIFDSDRGLNVEMGIQDGGIYTDKIADVAISTEKIQVEAIDSSRLHVDAVTPTHLQGSITFEALEKGDLEGLFYSNPLTDTTMINGSSIYTGSIYASDLKLKGELTVYNDDNIVTFAVAQDGDVKLSGDLSSSGDVDNSIDVTNGNGYYIKSTGEAQFRNIKLTDGYGSLNVGTKGFAGFTANYNTDSTGTILWVGREYDSRMSAPFRVSLSGAVTASNIDTTNIQSSTYVLKDAPNFRLDSTSGLRMNGTYGFDLNGNITAASLTIEDEDGNLVSMGEGRVTNSGGLLVNSELTNFSSTFCDTGFTIKNNHTDTLTNVFTDSGGRMIFDKNRYLSPNVFKSHEYLTNYDFIFGSTNLNAETDASGNVKQRSNAELFFGKNANVLVTGDVKATSFSFIDASKDSKGKHQRRIACENGVINFY